MGRRKQTDISDIKVGHNSNLNADEKAKLAGFVSEIERVGAEIRELTAENGTIYKAVKESGFDTKAVKHIVKLRRMEVSKRAAFETYCDAYALALGMLADTPLGRAAMKRDGVAQHNTVG